MLVNTNYPRKLYFRAGGRNLGIRRSSAMPHCSVCCRDLPRLETLCSRCFETRYSELAHPKPFLASTLSYLSNSLGAAAQSKLRMPLSSVIFCCSAGILLCWFAGFAKLGYQYSFFSGAVLSESFQVLVKSAGLSLALSLFLARKNLRLYRELYRVPS